MSVENLPQQADHNALSQDYEPMPADDALRQLTQQNLYLYGHGTPLPEYAEAILHEGLGLRDPDLGTTAMSMPTEADDTNAFERDKAYLENWPHRGHNYVVMLGVERLPDDDVPHRRYMSAIVQPQPKSEQYAGNDGGWSRKYVIDPRFVAGYFDPNKDVFMPNPNFDPRFDPTLLETTADISMAMQKLTMEDLFGGVGGTATGNDVVVHAPRDHAHDDIPEIW